MSQPKNSENFEFKAEVNKLLNIITHSLYTNREIFLRELVSNASDALDKLRFLVSKGEEVADPDLPLEITISLDKDKKLLTVSDTGVGMSHDELVANLGTIAKSGSEEFLSKLAEEKNDAANIIGRFGVGFYSVFMVSEEVTVTSRSADKDGQAYVWRSDGMGGYSVEPLEGEFKRGTRIEARLREDAESFLDKDELQGVLKRHSNFISFPILLEGEKVNTIAALWREPKFSITKEQYDEFYKFLTFDHDEPLESLHVAVDAPVQFTSLAFIPKHSHNLFGANKDRYGLDLYVRRVLIQKENKDLIPEYLGFLKGVVDTEDLPLNISRESLQENVLVRKISATLTKQVLSHLEKVASGSPEKYLEFWKTHREVFKLGYTDYANREKFAPLLRFNSSTHEDASGLASLDEYVSRLKPDQKEIYYIFGPSREAVKLNPHLEIFTAKGLEVLFLYEPIDEFLMDALGVYKEHPLKAVESVDASSLDPFATVGDKKQAEELSNEDETALAGLLKKMQAILGEEKVKEVRVSKRLSDSPACLVSPDGSMTSSMQKILQIVSKDASIPQKVMEVNRDHALIRNLLRLHKADPEDEFIKTATEQLYESSLLQDGYLSDPHKLVNRINGILEKSSGWYTEIKKV